MLDVSKVPAAVRDVVATLRGAGHATFLVGGCVRDMLRGEPPKDFDVATSATPPQVQGLFKRVIPTGIEHGTVTVVKGGSHVEVTTFRTEGDYHDGRRPSKVEFHTDIEVDLSRRDFTINAMAFDPVEADADRAIVDPFGGRADLKARVVRCVRSAQERFSEDGLRALRAVRFATVLDFTIDPATEAAIEPTIPVFRKVAAERVKEELHRLLLARHAPAGLELLRRTRLLEEIAPEAVGADFSAVGRAPPELTLRLAALFASSPNARDVIARLRFPIKVAEDVGHLVTHRLLPPPDVSDAALRRWLSKVEAPRALPILELNRALSTDVSHLEERVKAQLAAKPPLATRELALDGRAVMAALGVGPSAAVGEAQRYLLQLVLDQPERNTSQALTEALQTWPGRAS